MPFEVASSFQKRLQASLTSSLRPPIAVPPIKILGTDAVPVSSSRCCSISSTPCLPVRFSTCCRTNHEKSHRRSGQFFRIVEEVTLYTQRPGCVTSSASTISLCQLQPLLTRRGDKCLQPRAGLHWGLTMSPLRCNVFRISSALAHAGQFLK